MSAVSITNEREIQPMQLSIEQLSALKNQHEDEIKELQAQLDTLANAKAKFQGSKETLVELTTTKESNMLYLPLTSSLYVPGKIVDPEKVSKLQLLSSVILSAFCRSFFLGHC
jgi:prefoldin alpha subunit